MPLTPAKRAAVAFLALPKEERPLTKEQFCSQVIQQDVRTLQRWAKDDEEFKQAVREARTQFNKNHGDLFDQVTRARAKMILISQMGEAQDKETRLKAAEKTLRYVPEQANALDTISYQAHTDGQLIATMFKRGMNLPAGELDQFRSLVGLEDLV